MNCSFNLFTVKAYKSGSKAASEQSMAKLSQLHVELQSVNGFLNHLLIYPTRWPIDPLSWALLTRCANSTNQALAKAAQSKVREDEMAAMVKDLLMQVLKLCPNPYFSLCSCLKLDRERAKAELSTAGLIT